MNKNLWKKCVDFHGHECPGLAIGFKAAEAAASILGIGFSLDEEVVCVTENDACGVDAIQVALGCTLGKGNLLFKNTGKQAYSFFCRKSGKKVRLVQKPFKQKMSKKERQKLILNTPSRELFNFKEPKFGLPKKAKVFDTIYCEICDEGTSEHKVRILNGKKVCLDCFDDYSRGWFD